MGQFREKGIYSFATPRNGRITLPWHFRNEVSNNGCLSLLPCYDCRHFSIARWLETDSLIYKEVEPLRFSELDEFSYESWECRMRPWERLQEKIATMPEFHSGKENQRYVIRMLDHIIDDEVKYDHLQMVTPPYGGRPLICLIRGGKVTIL